MIVASEATGSLVASVVEDDLEFDLPTAPDEHSFSALQERYEQLCEAAKQQLHDMLREPGSPRAAAG